MPRKVYKFVNGECVEVSDRSTTDVEAPFVHDDTLSITSMIDGSKYDSKSKYMRHLKEHGCEVVGNDLLSNKKRVPREIISESMVLDRIERAEAVYSDPARRRAAENENYARLERVNKLLNTRY